jgi:hypothetical protein
LRGKAVDHRDHPWHLWSNCYRTRAAGPCLVCRAAVGLAPLGELSGRSLRNMVRGRVAVSRSIGRSPSPLRRSRCSPRFAATSWADRGSGLDRPAAAGSVIGVATERYDLWFDPNSVGGDMVVECWIGHGPHANDPDFAPVPGDWLVLGDGDEAPLRARVIKRQGDRVSVQIQLGAEGASAACRLPRFRRSIDVSSPPGAVWCRHASGDWVAMT